MYLLIILECTVFYRSLSLVSLYVYVRILLFHFFIVDAYRKVYLLRLNKSL